MELGLKGKRALVTGASSGLGLAAATALAGEGVEVVINSRNGSTLSTAARKIADLTGVTPVTLVGDVSNESDITRIMGEAGDIDILVSNSGGPPAGQFSDLSSTDWKSAADLLLHSAVGLTRGLIDGMIERKWGRLIYITSISVLQPIDDLILSNSLRAGVTGMCKTISNNYAKHGITANCVCPGYTATERLNELADSRASELGLTREQIFEKFAADVPARRLGEPDELASLITFLASDRAAYITGTSIPVDGGWARSLT